jgi:hypothetical protein
VKKLLVIGGTVAGLTIVCLVVASFYLGSIVAKAINTFAPDLMQTKVAVSGASISPFSGEGTLRGFVVRNPKGWSDANLGALSKIHVSVVPRSVFGDHVIIRDIEIDGPEFNYETKVLSSNVNDLLANIERVGGGGSSKTTTKNGKPIKIEVQHFLVRDGVVRLGVGAAAVTIPLPPIELSDIGTKEGGVTPNQMTATVMRSVTGGIVRATTQALAKAGANTGAAAVEGVKDASKSIKGLFGGKKK